MSAKPSVAFCVPFFGPWPRWMPLFLESIKRNTDCFFLLFGDNPIADPLPENASFTRMSLEELSERAAGVIGNRMPILDAHKVCDLRPFFGLIFKDYLQGYAFWGYCDIDLVFGDLTPLTRPERLSETDVFSASDSQIVGHFTFLRNREDINRLCFEIEGYKERISIPTTTFMDEGPLALVVWKHSELRWLKPSAMEQELRKPFAETGASMIHPDGRLWKSPFNGRIICVWENGRAFVQEKNGSRHEVLYIHFMALKRPLYWIRYRRELSYKRFAFSPAGFCPWTEPPTPAEAVAESLIEHAARLISVSRGLAGRILPRRTRVILRGLLRG